METPQTRVLLVDDGDPDACLAPGTDACFAKPIDAQELHLSIAEVRQPASVPEGPKMPEDNSLVDWSAAMAAVDGREDLLKELIGIFFEEYPVLISQIAGAIRRSDAPELKLTAHRLKGCLRYFGDNDASRFAEELECRGRDNRWDGVTELLNRAQAAIERMLPALRAYRS